MECGCVQCPSWGWGWGRLGVSPGQQSTGREQARSAAVGGCPCQPSGHPQAQWACRAPADPQGPSISPQTSQVLSPLKAAPMKLTAGPGTQGFVLKEQTPGGRAEGWRCTQPRHRLLSLAGRGTLAGAPASPLQPRLLQRQPSLNHAGPLRLRAFSQRCSRSPGSARLGSAHPRRQPSGTPPLGGLGPRLPPSPLPRASPTESQPPPGPAGACPSARVCACSGQEGTSTLGHRLRVLPREGITPSGALHPPALGGAAQTRPAGPSGRSRPLQECARGRGGRRSGLTRRDTLGMERGGVEGPGLPVGPAAPGSSTWRRLGPDRGPAPEGPALALHRDAERAAGWAQASCSPAGAPSLAPHTPHPQREAPPPQKDTPGLWQFCGQRTARLGSGPTHQWGIR